MKQKTLTMIPLLCAAVAPLCADTQGMNNKTDQQRQQKYRQDMNMITPIADPCVDMWADPFISADYIYWRVQEDGLEYASTGVGSGPGVASGVADAGKGHLFHPEFEYNSGFKVGGGLKFRHDGWDLYAQYTWLHTHDTSNQTAPTDSNLVSNIFIPTVTAGGVETLGVSTLTSASASWRAHFNVLDVELGRNFWISKWLTLRPFTGMKFSWNKQTFDVTYNGYAAATGIAAGSSVLIDNELKQFGVGIRSGLDTAWYFARHFSMYGEFAVAGLMNYFRSHRQDINTTTGIMLNNLGKDSAHRITAVIEWALGLRYETTWSNDDYMFTLQAGWEEQIWFNQNQFVFMPNSAANDMNLEGFTLKAAFNF